MAKLDFRTQDGLIVGDGNLLVLNPSGSTNADAIVFAKEFSTHGHQTDLLAAGGLELRGNEIEVTAHSNTANANLTLTPKGTGSVFIPKVDINGGTIDGVAITGTSATFTSLNLSEGNITNVGDINADSISVDAAGTGLNVDFSGGNTATSKLTLGDNLADALNITEASNSYMKFITTNGSEQIVFGENSTFASTTIANLGTVSAATSITSTAFVGPIDGIVGGNTPAAGSFTSIDMGEGNITNVGHINVDGISVDSASVGLTIDFSGANSTSSVIKLKHDSADALSIIKYIGATEHNFIKFKTTLNDDQIIFGKNSTFAGTTIANLGTVSAATSITTTAFETYTLLTNSHARINGTAREQNTLLQVNGDFVASGANLGGGGSAASQNTLKYAEVRIHSDIANEDLDAMNVEEMGGVYIIDNGTNAPFTGQGSIYTVGDSGTGDAWGAGRQATTGKYAIGYINKDYDNIADSSSNPMRTGQARLEIDTSGNTTLSRVGAYLAFTGATSGAAEREIRFVASSNAISSNNTGAQTYTLPTDFPSSTSKVLQSTTNGTLSWVAQSGGIALSDLSVSTASASGGGALSYASGTGVFTYTPPLNITGNAGTVTVADESSDTTCFPLFATAASGSLAPKTGTNLTFNSSTGQLTQTGTETGAVGLVLKNTKSNSGNSVNGQVLRFVTNRGGSEAGQNNDDFGMIEWYGNDSNGNNQNFGMIKVRAADVTSGAEKGSMQFAVATSGNSGGIENVLTITGGAAAASSTVTIAGNLVVDGATTSVSTQELEVEDALITVAKGNNSLVNANGAGLEIECTGATNPSFTYQNAPDAFEANTHLNLNTGKEYKINDVSILSATTIGSSVTSAAGLATVGTITTGVWNGTAITDAYVADALTISGGTIDNSVIGGSTAAAGTFTNLTASNLSVDSVAVLDTSTNTNQSFVNNSAVTIASFAFGTYRTVKFVGHVIDEANGGDTDAFEVLVSYKGANGPASVNDTMITTYAYMSSGTTLGGLNVVLTDPGSTGSDTHIALQFTNSTGSNFTGAYAVTATQLIKT